MPYGWRPGMLALMVFVLRQTSSDRRWAGIEKFVALGFWGINVGLAMMVVMSLFPGGNTATGTRAVSSTSAATGRT